MTHKIKLLLLVIIGSISNNLIAQVQKDTTLNENTAYLYFYRAKQFVGCGNKIGIQINNKKIQKIKNGNRLIIEVSHLNDHIEITTSNTINSLTAYSKLVIKPEGGKIYYIEVNWDNVYDRERKEQVKIAGLGINFILKDEQKGKVEFYDNSSFKDKQNLIEHIKY